MLIVFQLFCVGRTIGSTENAWSPESVFAFAENLEFSGEYYRAITEYRRLLFHWPEHPLSMECRYRIGQSYLHGEDHEHAISAFTEFLAECDQESMKRRIRYGLARAYFGAERWNFADAELESLVNQMKPLTLRSILYSRLWCRLKSGDRVGAITFWEQSIMDHNGVPPAEVGRIEKSLQEILSQPEKRPQLAGMMSALVPGLGQTYAGRWRDGLVSFLVNGLFIGAIAVAIDRNHDETAAVLGFFELGFYSANIYNAVNDAHKTNRMRYENSLLWFENRHGPPFAATDPSLDP